MFTNKSNKFKIEAGIREGDTEKFENEIKNMTPEEIISAYKLGEVADYESLLKTEKPTPRVVEADHIPPKSCLKDLHGLINTNPEIKDLLQTKNKALYNLVMGMKNDQNGRHKVCMNALYWDHQSALTSGSSLESQACRELLTRTFANGDVEKAIKLSLIMAHPECSDRIRDSLGIQNHLNTQNPGLEAAGIKKYYKNGFLGVLHEYNKRGVLDQNQRDRLENSVQSFL
ncbi:uncharacterized protein DAT39_020426 [Clarias magur]|uniref:Uncharacterized protein n=1 Tax=Clarias magur TaxID=1594786 RepID=A0A8J4TC24_CLAMG|nr:uncharacterized protein DAT39_020426 [Clarias magur]